MLSIIIPTLNEEDHLRKLLKCIKAQTYKDYEIIVADAGSKDRTRQVAKSFGVKVVKGGLPSFARNNGVKHSKYDLLLFLDADVSFDKNFIKNCLHLMRSKNLDVATVFSSPSPPRFIDQILVAFWDFWVFTTQKFFPHAPGYCIFASRKTHYQIKGFDERIRLGEDANYAMKAGKVSRFGVLPIHITMSTRRFYTEGHLNFVKKMLHCGILRIFGKEDYTNKFKYEYNTHKKH